VNSLIGIIAITSPLWLALIVAGIDQRHPFIHRIADRIFPNGH
jgi:hypothetical protein